jgi:hypothetical protein
MGGFRIFVAALVGALASAAYAEPPIASFASGQLRFAESALERAREAGAAGDAALARRYAAQAELDARLAWSMTPSAHMRRAAADVARDVARLRQQLAAGRAPRERLPIESAPLPPRPVAVAPPASPGPAPALRLPELPSVDLTSTLTRH